MEAQKKRNIKNGEEYSHLFPKAENSFSTIRTNANVTDTVAFIPKVVNETLDQTKKIAQLLKADTTYKTCSNIWHFVYQHIAYKKDQEGYEQIRSPARTWNDRKQGVDCDCYSTFISSILTNLGIKHKLRITKYWKDYYQHIYPVVENGTSEIILDCVTDKFNYEVPYSQKKDYPMDLQYLNGFDGNDMGELGKVLAKKIKSTAKKPLPQKQKFATKLPLKIGKKIAPTIVKKIKAKIEKKPALQPASNSSASSTAKAAAPKKVKGIKKILNKVNKVNPATVLLRNGILAAMKLNIKNIAKRLRWSYLTPEQASKHGIDPSKFQRLVATRTKLENIFFGAGGKTANLKKAILGGKGNSDKAVNGLEGISFSGVQYMNANTDLPQLLGQEIYYSENIEGFEGLGQLGEPVTLTSIGAAMGVLAGIIASLKQIGDIFPKGAKGSKDFDEKLNEAAENNQPVPDTTTVPQSITPATQNNSASTIVPNAQVSIDDSFKQPDNTDTATPSSTTTNSNTASNPATTNTFSVQDQLLPIQKTDSTIVPVSTDKTVTTATDDGSSKDDPNKNDTDKQTIWEKYKWLKPVAIGVGGIGVIAIGYALLKPKDVKHHNSSNGKSLSGLPKNRKHKKNKNHHRKQKSKHQHSKKQAIALL